MGLTERVRYMHFDFKEDVDSDISFHVFGVNGLESFTIYNDPGIRNSATFNKVHEKDILSKIIGRINLIDSATNQDVFEVYYKSITITPDKPTAYCDIDFVVYIRDSKWGYKVYSVGPNHQPIDLCHVRFTCICDNPVSFGF